MNDSLFTRQLTSFREWPDKKKGALFYVYDPDAVFPYDYIVLIDSPARSLDKIGAYDQLHEAEIKAISKDSVVIAGYAAFLIFRFFEEERKRQIDILPFFSDTNEWKTYCKRNEQQREFDFYNYMIEWNAVINCKQQYLNIILKPFLAGLFSHDLSCLLYLAYQVPFRLFLTDNHTLFYDLEMKIRFYDPQNMDNKWIANYNKDKRKWLLSSTSKFPNIDGFMAFIMNYAAANAVCSEFLKYTPVSNFITSINELIKRIWSEYVDYEYLNIKPRELNPRLIYDAYIAVAQEDIMYTLSKKSVPFTIMDENKKKAIVLKHLFRKEWKKARQQINQMPYISKTHRKLLDIALNYFFDYILQLLKDFPDEYNECKQLINNDTSTNAQTSETIATENTQTTTTTTHEPRPLLRNSFINNLDKVYDILVLENLVLPNQFELFEKAMTLQLQPEQRIIWKGLKYKLASFIAYAYEGSQSNTWLAANAWCWKGKPVTPELKDHLFKSHTDESAKKWKELFQNLQ